MSADSTIEPPTPYGWDWTATTHAAGYDPAKRDPFTGEKLLEDDRPLREQLTPAEVAAEMVLSLCGTMHLPGGGLQGWTESVEAYDDDGYKLGAVYFGGGRQDVHVVSSSAAADEARRRVLAVDPSAKTARVDTRVDSLVGFDQLARVLEEAAESYGSQIVTMARREGRRGDRKDTGRTVYLGAPSSAVRVRLYEKWLESPGQYVDGTNRVEVQLRPASRVKARVSSWSPAETFCASRVTQGLAQRLGADVATASLHVNRGTPDLERTLAAMGEQYGKAVGRWMDLHPESKNSALGTVLDHLGL